MPALDQLHKDYQAKGLVVVTVSAEPRADIQAFTTEFPYSMVGTYLKHPDEPAAAFITAPGTQPITWIIDRQGTIREVKLGGQGYEIFAAAVGKYL